MCGKRTKNKFYSRRVKISDEELNKVQLIVFSLSKYNGGAPYLMRTARRLKITNQIIDLRIQI